MASPYGRRMPPARRTPQARRATDAAGHDGRRLRHHDARVRPPQPSGIRSPDQDS
ncbi:MULTISPECIES: hypothetical protein [unclassified Leifsonia]|uniref:hypothetical protein n=1 Tax=unclassified Leifsonia TaxID=2663824 RepID=UPI0012FC1109|nr:MULTISPECIES: hypothetical protein [unclassified Leifsonia]